MKIITCSINDDINILGHTFHGLRDIRRHVEKSLMRDFTMYEVDDVEPMAKCDVHVGHLWVPYPCFDMDDFANESRFYHNFIFRRRPITRDDMRLLWGLPAEANHCRVTELLPPDIGPILYYLGCGDTMLLAVK